MLPTQGLFRSIPCPYYISGLCERPHCLFRHTKSDVILARKPEICSEEEEEQEDQERHVVIKCEASERDTSTIIPAVNAEIVGEQTGDKGAVDKKIQEVCGQKRKAAEELVNETKKAVYSKSIKYHRDADALITSKCIKIENIKVESDADCIILEQVDKPKSSGSRNSSKHKSSKSSTSRSSSHNKERNRPQSHSPSTSRKSESNDKPRKSSRSSHSKSGGSRSDSRKHSSTKSSHSRNGTKDQVVKDKKVSKTPLEDRKKSEHVSLKKETIVEQDQHSRIENKPIDDCDVEDFSLPEISDYEDDPDEIELECLRLFQEYRPEEKLPTKDIVIETPIAPVDIGKKRQAHAGAEKIVVKNLAKGRPTPSNLHSIIAKRIESQKAITNSTTTSTIDTLTVRSTSVPSTSPTKKRIAYVPNVSGLLRSPTLLVKPESGKSAVNIPSVASSGTTIPKTSVKGSNRVAHSTVKNIKKRPIVSIDSPSKGNSKIPTAIRQKVLDQLFEAAVNIYDNNQDAFTRAIEEEAAIETRSKTKPVYLSLAVGKVRAIRKELDEPKPKENASENDIGSIAQFHDSQRVLRTKNKGGIVRPTGPALYNGLNKFILTEAQLSENGFPRPHPTSEPGRAAAQRSGWDREYVSERTRRTCDRCHKVFEVTENGEQLPATVCTFHPGRKSFQKVNRTLVVTYSCCGDEKGSSGCTVTSYHVPKSHPVSDMRGFVTAVQSAGADEDMGTHRWDIVGVDCEMVYTTTGNALARATFLDDIGNKMYDQLIKPPDPILDYNTVYSGITEEMMKDVTTTLTDVQAVLLTELRPNSILVGHSLESDLIALRLRHDSVVDTSVLYPHRRGLPYKRALRTITSEHLHQIIQQSEHGHDSAEDARAALDLAILYVHNNSHL